VPAIIKDIDKHTGQSTDMKTFTKLYHTGTETPRGRVTNVVDFLKAVGASPETIKQHGG